MSEQEAQIRITSERLQNVIEALSYASVDEFEACLALLERNMEEDEFNELETAFMIFVKELRAAKGALTEALARHEAANRELEAKLETIERQQAAIRELSTPIIEVWDGVVALPVIGRVSPERAVQMMQLLLETIATKRAEFAIVDLTGDAHFAEVFFEDVELPADARERHELLGLRERARHLLVCLQAGLSGRRAPRGHGGAPGFGR